MKVEDTSVCMTINVKSTEVEADSLEIKTTDHIGPSIVSHVTRNDTDMQTVHTRIELTSNFVLIME